MANPWFRMYAEFATDPKVQMLNEANQRRLLMVLCLRCNGDVTLQDEEVAFQLRISNDEWSTTKSTFVEKGFIDSTNKVLNWDKRQFVSDSSAERVARHRSNKKVLCNVTVTPPDTDTDTDTDTERDKESTTVVVLKEKKVVVPQFKKPSLDELVVYCTERGTSVDPETFHAHYESNGWVVGQAKAKMKCWKSAVINWEKRDKQKNQRTDYVNTNPKPSTGVSRKPSLVDQGLLSIARVEERERRERYDQLSVVS